MEKGAPIQLEIFDVGWPPHERFPYNNHIYRVKELVEADLVSTRSPLIITGYASLNTLLDFFARCFSSQFQANPIRILLGHEPFIREHQTYSSPHIILSEQIKQYWLEHRISLYHSMKIILAIEWLKSGRLQAKIGGEQHPLHAKIYKGDTAITIGSSNFSHSGLVHQTEANVRFCASGISPLPFGSKRLTKEQVAQVSLQEQKARSEQERFEEACTFAEKLWSDGLPYDSQLQALLEALLQVVGWQEALARACAEVLEGTWVKHYMEQSGLEEGPPLWPSQEQGIAQAMWVIEHVGSVLIADATGSGKTQMGAHLIKAVMNRTWSRGLNRRHDPPVLIAPGGVIEEWNRVSDDAGLALKIYSDALVSRKQAEGYEVMERVIRRAQVLAVDEAHRYHNRKSTRTQQLYHNLADYVVLFTATPVNRNTVQIGRRLQMWHTEKNTIHVLPHRRLPMISSLRQIAPESKLCHHCWLPIFEQVIAQESILQVLSDLGAFEQRERRLSMMSIITTLIAMSVYPHLPIQEVMQEVLHTPRELWPDEQHAQAVLASKAAFSSRRKQLGGKPLQVLFHRLARPLATATTPGAFALGYRLVAIDGTIEALPDTPTNAKVFGRLNSGKGACAFPQVRCLLLQECGTHAILDATFWPCTPNEQQGALRLLRSLTPEMLVLLDTGFRGYPFHRAVQATGAQFLSRLPSSDEPEVIETLEDGSLLALLRPSDKWRRKQDPALLVRLIEYTLTDPTWPGFGQRHRLLTSLLDRSTRLLTN